LSKKQVSYEKNYAILQCIFFSLLFFGILILIQLINIVQLSVCKCCGAKPTYTGTSFATPYFLGIFTYMALKKDTPSFHGSFLFEITCMASKRKSLPSIAFHPIQALDGVKCGVK
jgi:hypothetical protein